jgi:hypothetical protein
MDATPWNALDAMNGKTTLVLLVGANPLPNYLAAATLRPQRVLLLYTPETMQPKDRLTRALRDRLRIAAVDDHQVEDATSAKRVRGACESVFSNDVHLNYTGGTKVMAAIARMVFRDRGGLDRDASYVNESDGLLRFDDDGPSRALVTDALDLDAILALHAFDKRPASTALPHDPAGPDAEAMACACLANPPLARSTYEHLTQRDDTRGRAIKASDFRTSPLTDPSFPGRPSVPGADWNNKESEHWIKFLRGTWLELWTAGLVRERAGSGASVHVGVNLTRETREAELDLIMIRQHRLHLLSCTIDDTIDRCKLKLFEATWRARQVGGDLDRCALACFLSTHDADKVRADVAATWGESNTPTVFDLADLRAWQGLDQTTDHASLDRWLLS